MSISVQARNDSNPAGSALNDDHQVQLFKPKTFRGLTLHNRVVVSPMCMYSCTDGMLNDFHIAHLGSFAINGAGLIIIEATAVEPQGRISPDDSGLWDDAQIPPLKRVVDFVKAQGSAIGIQLAHAGRKADMSSPWKGYKLVPNEEGGWPDDVWGPSEGVPFNESHAQPHALSVSQINGLVQKFVDAAIRADKAGVDLIEIHSAHGYLLHNFLSKNSNKRTDEYGGSLENRMRFPLEVVRAVRANWPKEKPLFVRVSSTDYSNPSPLGEDPDGWDVWQTVAFAKKLKELGVDLVDCSSGGNISHVSYAPAPLYQAVFAETVKREAQVETGAVGMITKPEEAEGLLEKGQADLVFIAREFLRNSEWVIQAAKALNVPVHWPKQYARAQN